MPLPTPILRQNVVARQAIETESRKSNFLSGRTFKNCAYRLHSPLFVNYCSLRHITQAKFMQSYSGECFPKGLAQTCPISSSDFIITCKIQNTENVIATTKSFHLYSLHSQTSFQLEWGVSSLSPSCNLIKECTDGTNNKSQLSNHMIFTKERLSNICIDLCTNSFAYKAEIFPL